MDKLYEALKSKWNQFELFEAAANADKKLVQAIEKNDKNKLIAALEAGADPNVAFNMYNIFDTFDNPEIGKLIINHAGDRLTKVYPKFGRDIYSQCFEHRGMSELLEILIKRGLVKVSKIMINDMISSIDMVLKNDFFRDILLKNMSSVKIDNNFISTVLDIIDDEFAQTNNLDEQNFDEFLSRIKRVDTNLVDIILMKSSQNVYSQKFKNHILNLIKNPKVRASKDNTDFNFVEEIRNPSIIKQLKNQPQFIKWYLHPRQEAIKYNRRYGIFLHSFNNIRSINYIYGEGKNIEICVSTLDSRTVYIEDFILIGAGDIRLLYDFDCYSEIDEINGKRYATTEGTEYDSLKISDLKLKKPDRIKKGFSHKLLSGEKIGDRYYDEGFIKPKDTNWLIISGNDVDGYFKRKNKKLLDILNEYGLKYLPSNILNFALKEGKINKLKEYIDFKERRLVASENEDEFEAITDEIRKFVQLLKADVNA